MKKRRRFTSEFKSKVALEALREHQPIHKLAKRYQIHPTQVREWKKALLAMPVAFSRVPVRSTKRRSGRSSRKTVYKSRSASSRWRWIF